MLGSPLFRKVSGIELHRDATGGTGTNQGGCLGSIFVMFAGGLTHLPRLVWFLLWLAATLGAVAVGGAMLVLPA